MTSIKNGVVKIIRSSHHTKSYEGSDHATHRVWPFSYKAPLFPSSGDLYKFRTYRLLYKNIQNGNFEIFYGSNQKMLLNKVVQNKNRH